MTTREKLAALGKHKRTVTIEVAGESVEVIYQRPTAARDRVLHESAVERYNELRRKWKIATEDGESEEQTYRNELVKQGIEAAIRIILGVDKDKYVAQAIESLDEELSDDADEDTKKAYDELAQTAYEGIISRAIAEMKEHSAAEDLYEKAIDIVLSDRANRIVWPEYRYQLIADSIRELEPPHERVFISHSDVAEMLVQDTIDALGTMIQREVDAQRGLPLRSA
jgi:tetratricopeptide (TPR) repeat protein